LKARFLFVVALAMAVFCSALAVVYVKHMNRKLFVELQALERERDRMQVEWGRLQLEQNAWATHGRIDRVAREQLELYMPPIETVIGVTP
jgi:cell division protein FtsL